MMDARHYRCGPDNHVCQRDYAPVTFHAACCSTPRASIQMKQTSGHGPWYTATSRFQDPTSSGFCCYPASQHSDPVFHHVTPFPLQHTGQYDDAYSYSWGLAKDVNVSASWTMCTIVYVRRCVIEITQYLDPTAWLDRCHMHQTERWSRSTGMLLV